MNRKERRFAAKQGEGPQRDLPGASDRATSPAELFAAALHEFQSGQLARAEELCRQILATHPAHVDSLHLLGGIAHQTGRNPLAAEFIGRAIALNSRIPAFHSNLAAVYRALGRPDDAVIACKRALALDPRFAEAHVNLGIMYAEQGLIDQAIASYRRALASKGDSTALQNSLGIALHEQGKLEEAAAAYRRAIALTPGGAEAYNNLGNTLQKQDRLAEAIDCYARAIALRPDFVEAIYGRALALKELGQLAEARTGYQQALAANPDYRLASVQLAALHARICDWSDSERETEYLRATIREHAKTVPPFDFLAFRATPAEQLLCAERWIEGMIAKDVRTFSHHRPASPRKIRLGYFSADFRDHPVGFLMAELIERHDRTKFDVVAYSFGPDDGSATRQRFTATFDRFTDVRTDDDDAVARRIHADGIDILVDLTGHTSHARTRVVASRPAPIQVNFLGYPGTMGAAFIDYIIVDPFVVPTDQQPFFSERLVHMPQCYQPRDTTRPVGTAAGTRIDHGLPPDGFVFCCFNNSFKLNPTMFDAWMGLLKAVPGSVLWLYEGAASIRDLVTENLRREAQARGVAGDRLVFAPGAPQAEHLARHRLADLFLDTLPYNAHTTASDALWAGLPVLTWTGDAFAGRVAGSLLTAIGLPELITGSLDQYESLARQLASDPARLADLRARLARNRTTMPLFDSARFARDIEAAYTKMWETWRAGEAPKPFAVAAS